MTYDSQAVQSEVVKLPKIKLSIVPKIVIAIMLVVTGMMIQDRYHFTQQVSQRFQPSSSDLSSLALAKTLSGSNKAETVNMSQFWEVWAHLENDFLETDKLDETKMMDGATYGMTAALGDPYTTYLPPKENQRSSEDLAGAFYGVGIELGYVDGVLAVVAPLPDSPAAKAGVEAGDLILQVKDTARNFESETTGWSLNQAVEEIRGPKGSTVTLTLYREGNGAEPFDVDIMRDEIVVKTVELDFPTFQNKRVAHIKLMRFGGRTDGEWDQVVNQILEEKGSISGVVLDMRNNPGGFFDGAIDVASEFIREGVVVSQEGKYDQEDYSARGTARLANVPVVVLVNKGSASASEIVAGAIRDRLGAKMVGVKTFGKGTVQDRRELSNGGGLHVTIARWVLPSGSWIHHEGIPVDVEVKDDPQTEPDEALNKAIEIL